MTTNKTPHKHAELIKAWADGAEIQYQDFDGSWKDDYPNWVEGTEYRIKPEEKKPVVRWLWAYKTIDGWAPTTNFYSEEEMMFTKRIKLEWSRTEFPE